LGQLDAAAPDFIEALSYPPPLKTTSSRHRLSSVCHPIVDGPLTTVASPFLAVGSISKTVFISGWEVCERVAVRHQDQHGDVEL